MDCGIACARIEAWLDDELGLPRREGGWLQTGAEGTCRIAVERLEPRHMGRFALERTRLTAEGPRGAIDVFERLFTLRFMSAGG